MPAVFWTGRASLLMQGSYYVMTSLGKRSKNKLVSPTMYCNQASASLLHYRVVALISASLNFSNMMSGLSQFAAWPCSCCCPH